MSMPKWPIELGGYPTSDNVIEYERARADAAMARLKVAVEALRYMRESEWMSTIDFWLKAERAIAVIDLPEEK
jgi:hypothetical protein